jgi:mannose-6-phosphate isomerase-like protein (cupin superfamily)
MRYFKYRGGNFERDLKSLVEDYFWASEISNLNDPYEFMVEHEFYRPQLDLIVQILSNNSVAKNEFDKVHKRLDSLVHKAKEAESKVKRLIVEPGQSISMQRHFQRAEIWFVESGNGVIYTQTDGVAEKVSNLPKHALVHIECQDWHQLKNESSEPLVIVEIQYGNYCDESDIERL